jgi:nucleolar MIF4G domain-containing protein 1
MGETSVGGEEVIKNLKDDYDGFDIKGVSTVRLKNIAKAYAWWIAKDCTSLVILKVSCFTSCANILTG